MDEKRGRYNIEFSDTLWSLFEKSVQRNGRKIALAENLGTGVRETSYQTMFRKASMVRNDLMGRRIQQEKIVLMGDVSREWLEMFFGITGSGNLVVPMDATLPCGQIWDMMLNIGAICLLFDVALEEKIVQLKVYIDAASSEKTPVFLCLQKSRMFSCVDDFIRGKNEAETRMEVRPVCADDEAMVVFTSGTEGYNKGVVLTHSNLCCDIVCCVFLIGPRSLPEDGKYVHVLPMHHMFGLTTGILAGLLYYGATICFGGGAKQFFRNLQLFSPDILVVVPMILESMSRMCRKSPDAAVLGTRLNIVVTGGAALNEKLLSVFEERGINLLNGYGMTECSPVISCNMIGKQKPGSVGVPGPKPYCEVRICEGEVQVRGKILFKRYTGQKDRSDGWFSTGDLGYMDEDGFLYLTGRKKSLIVLEDGNNIYPEKLEEQLLQSKFVEEALVYAGHYDKGTFLTARIYPKDGWMREMSRQEKQRKLEEVVEEINSSNQLFERIYFVEITETHLARTSIGKIKRNEA